MPSRIEDYALIGNRNTGALVGRDGSIDWLCFPRFDSGACFAALLGKPDHGSWKIGPEHAPARVDRRYRSGTLVLETEVTTDEGRAVLVDAMASRSGCTDVLRLVRGLEGTVRWRNEMRIQFDYGSASPWISPLPDGRFRAIAGPDLVVAAGSKPIIQKRGLLLSEFEVKAGEEAEFSLTWLPSHLKLPASPEVARQIERATREWRAWSRRYKPQGPYDEAILRSLITLQALTNAQTGGIVAAATTSLPEQIGGRRNWDYRYCWLRDATFTLYAFMHAGFEDEARSWLEWLLRAVAGSPDEMQILYGVNGERRLPEFELGWLDGYENSKPVRVGNAASGQLQLDVFGEVLDLMYQAQRSGLPSSADAWNVARTLTNHVCGIWNQPDEGIWEVRGGRRQFTHSKVMAWVALDRAIRSSEEFGHIGHLERWRPVRDQIHADVLAHGFNQKMGSFAQYYGGDTLDASLLMMPQVGFLKADDPAVKGTVAAIEKRLMRDGLLRRYDPHTGVDGVPGSEGMFLPCTFWLADVYTMQGRLDEAREIFEHLLTLRNDVGLLSEEYDPNVRRQLGNVPQAFTHVALINTALNLSGEKKPAAHRSER
jgi:GH15 family glucan-1,4-alpha-glucosidase